MNNLRERDYQFYDCTVKELSWNEGHDALTICCHYLNRDRIKILVSGVRKYEYIEVMINHTIEYMIPSISENGVLCYEVHFKQLEETSKIWAERMALV